jgi:hypothetical protein
MSLELAAQHLASRGRKGDTMLVHMAPQEVRGLQALAKAGGGTLTLNPDTGLPEANFLKKMLPMIIGAALTPLTGGLINPMTAGMLVGGVETARTGSLGRGLMAGLGAYGGAGLASSLMGAGTGALSSAAGTAGANSAVPAVADAGIQSVVPELASQGAGVSITPLGAEAANLSQTGPNLFGGGPYLGAGQGAEYATIGNPINAAQAVPTVTPPPATPYPTALSQNAADIGNAYAQEQAAQNAVAKQLATATPMDTLGAGLKNPSQLMTAGNLKYGLSALAPAMAGDEPEPYKGSGPNPYNFAFDWERPEGPSYDSREAMQLQGRLRRIPSMAAGGPIEEMSDRNQMETMMANGGQMFAEGGETKADVAKGMTGASAEAFRYLMGQSAASPATLAAQQFNTRSPAVAPMAMAPAADSGRGISSMMARSTGAMEDDPNRPYNFNFDPTSGQLIAGLRAQRPVVEMPPSLDAKNGGLMSMARGGVSHLGDYSDGGRLLKGPGDGVSDSIPATIANKRPARLADGEFVVPARIVSELGNGSTEAGARKLYAMMDRVQKARKKSIGKNRVAVNSRAEKLLPA